MALVERVINVVLAWLLKLGGTTKDPTRPSPERPGSSTKLVEVRLARSTTLIKKEDMEGDSDEEIDAELLSLAVLKVLSLKTAPLGSGVSVLLEREGTGALLTIKKVSVSLVRGVELGEGKKEKICDSEPEAASL